MSPDIPPAPPEAEVIRLARLATDMTAESAAEATRAHDGKGVSATYWRDVERGRGGRRGEAVQVRASERALAIMARVVGVTPAQLTEAGREDAARVLEEMQRRERPPRTRVNRSLRRTPATEPYAEVVELERKAGIPPRSPGEQDVWDSGVFGDEEKINFIAMMRLLNDTSARETSTGLYPRIRGFRSQQGHDAANWHVAADSLRR